MTTILVVDDERNIIDLAEMYLTKDGYHVLRARDGEEALTVIRQERPDLVVLDIMLPKLDGWEVCRRLRSEGDNTPVVMLTARDDDVDKIVGLELGADDYMTKPFNPRELVARVKAVLRRTEAPGPPSDKPISLGDVVIDPQRREVTVAGQAVPLRAKEFDLLVHFGRHPGLVLSREQLLDAVWGYDFYGDTRTVDVHVAHLRNKLAGCEAVQIETVWGIGYKLVERET
ncbi:MAG: response regulator transcription factor [Anaerolineae bacterium]